MEAVFSAYLQAGFYGSVIIGVIVLLRLLLRKAPRQILCILWLLAAVRLLVPVNLESTLSLQPSFRRNRSSNSMSGRKQLTHPLLQNSRRRHCLSFLRCLCRN